MRLLVAGLSIGIIAASSDAVVISSGPISGATVISDWTAVGVNNGEDGPVLHMGLTIESLLNFPAFNEILSGTDGVFTGGWEDNGASGGSVLRANTTSTDFRLTVPTEVQKAGFFFRASNLVSFEVQALNASNVVLESTIITPAGAGVEFIGFDGLVGLRAIRFTEQGDDNFSSAFDDVQWVIPAPATAALLAPGCAFLRRRRH
ncbi:MAG: hypothetical protein ACE5FA_10615 [Dehalococcoidia bacterium]